MKALGSRCANGANFGDALTAWLFAKLGVELEWENAQESQLIGCGSILESAPPGYAGIVLGAGMLYSKTRKDLRRARVLALRGRHTRERCGLLAKQSPILGDLGLVLGAFAPEITGEYHLGEIPHYVVYPEVKRLYESHPPNGALLIDATRPIGDVLTEAAKCRRIATSSLYGLVLADCLGIPSMWVKESRVVGKGFEFADYVSAFGESIRPGRWRQLPHARVLERGRELLGLAQAVAAEEVPGAA